MTPALPTSLTAAPWPMACSQEMWSLTGPWAGSRGCFWQGHVAKAQRKVCTSSSSVFPNSVEGHASEVVSSAHLLQSHTSFCAWAVLYRVSQISFVMQMSLMHLELSTGISPLLQRPGINPNLSLEDLLEV